MPSRIEPVSENIPSGRPLSVASAQSRPEKSPTTLMSTVAFLKIVRAPSVRPNFAPAIAAEPGLSVTPEKSARARSVFVKSTLFIDVPGHFDSFRSAFANETRANVDCGKVPSDRRAPSKLQSRRFEFSTAAADMNALSNFVPEATQFLMTLICAQLK